MLVMKTESAEEINFVIEILYRTYEDLAEDSFGWELTTVGDEVTRLRVSD